MGVEKASSLLVNHIRNYTVGLKLHNRASQNTGCYPDCATRAIHRVWMRVGF